MTAHTKVYRLLTGLYPQSFRREYASDLVQAFTDFARQHGVVSAWGRTCLDLAVTVPRYHLEVIMNRPASSTALIAVVLALALALAGLTGLVLGPAFGLPLLAIAALTAATQRSELARSLVVTPDQRRARLRTAGMLAIVFVAAVASWVYHVNRYESLGGTTVLVHNVIGVFSLVGTIAFGLAAVGTRERPATS